MKRFFSLLTLLLLCASLFAVSEGEEGVVPQFKRPDKAIEDLVMSAPLPVIHFNSHFTKAIVSQQNCRYVPIADLAANEVRIAGLRINTANFCETRESFANTIYLLDVATGTMSAVNGLPDDAKIKNFVWSADGSRVAFIVEQNNGAYIYGFDVPVVKPALKSSGAQNDTIVAKQLSSRRVNCVMKHPFSILANGGIIYKSVPQNCGQMPKEPLHAWPVVQENLGKKKSIRTYQDLISNPYDADLFEWVATSQLVIEDATGVREIGEKAIFREWELSPDCNYILATTEHRPYSYIQPHRNFPSIEFIMDLEGKVVKVLKDSQKEEAAKEAAKRDAKNAKRDSAKRGNTVPSGFAWRADMPATLYWSESENSPENEAPKGKSLKDVKDTADVKPLKEKNKEDKPEKRFTEKIWQCGAPFNFESDKVLVLAPEYKTGGPILWSNEKFALFMESSSKQKFRRLVAFVPCDTASRRVLITQSTEVDTLGNFPVYGKPYMVKNSFGADVVYTDAKNSCIYLTGGDRRDCQGDKMSFIDKLTLKDCKITNLWMAKAPVLEKLKGITDFNRLKFISTREEFTVVPDIWETSVNGKKLAQRQVTHFRNPAPQVEKLMTRTYVNYTRKDGLKCHANLYLPVGYDKEKDGPLPVFMWTYPYDYKCKAECEIDKPERYNYIKPSYGSAMIWASQGYAVLENFTMAIVAEHKDSLANDSFLPQLIMSAEAAVDFICDSIKVGDRNRIAVGGHSYGAYMTANLLSHTRLFKAGVARSGGYNRSLTPFGFQSERRNYWKANELYQKMSPFNYAHKMKDAMLLIHGQMDNNMGTFPDQSYRLYQAYVFNGATARYLQMPYESHSYLGIETILDMLNETGNWLEKYVKNAKPAKKDSNSENRQ